MRNPRLFAMTAVGLALFSARAVFAAANPAALNPTPNRESKLLADFESPVAVASDPLGEGVNRASINTDPQFVAEGSQSLKLDLNGVGGYQDYFVIQFPQMIDIQGYQVLSMDVYAPSISLNNGDLSNTATTYFELWARPTTTASLTDTKTVQTQYGGVSIAPGWNHMIWVLKSGTDTRLRRLAVVGNSNLNLPFTGPIYVDNIRLYKGNFAGLQPDEELIFGFDNPADRSLFTSADGSPIAINTDKQFISQGSGSLKVDLTGKGGGWSNGVALSRNFGTSVDVSKATALHLDVFVPDASYSPPGDWHNLGFVVIGDNGQVGGQTMGVQNVQGQWTTLEIPLTPAQAVGTLGHIKGFYLIRNTDIKWAGPIYVDNLRAVVTSP